MVGFVILATTEQTMHKANQTGESLQHIMSSIAHITAITGRIAEASEQHTGVAADIDSRVDRISSSSRSATGGSTETASKSRELTQLGDELQCLVAQFKV